MASESYEPYQSDVVDRSSKFAVHDLLLSLQFAIYGKYMENTKYSFMARFWLLFRWRRPMPTLPYRFQRRPHKGFNSLMLDYSSFAVQPALFISFSIFIYFLDKENSVGDPGHSRYDPFLIISITRPLRRLFVVVCPEDIWRRNDFSTRGNHWISTKPTSFDLYELALSDVANPVSKFEEFVELLTIYIQFSISPKLGHGDQFMTSFSEFST